MPAFRLDAPEMKGLSPRETELSEEADELASGETDSSALAFEVAACLVVCFEEEDEDEVAASEEACVDDET